MASAGSRLPLDPPLGRPAISRSPGTPTALPGLPTERRPPLWPWRCAPTTDDSAKSWHKHCRIYDGRGRIVQEYSDTERGQLVVNRRFDGRGLLVSESAPRKESCLAGSFAERVWRKDRDFKSSRTYDTPPPAGPGHPARRRDHRASLRRLVPAPWSTRTTTSSAGTATA